MGQVREFGLNLMVIGYGPTYVDANQHDTDTDGRTATYSELRNRDMSM